MTLRVARGRAPGIARDNAAGMTDERSFTIERRREAEHSQTPVSTHAATRFGCRGLSTFWMTTSVTEDLPRWQS